MEIIEKELKLSYIYSLFECLEQIFLKISRDKRSSVEHISQDKCRFRTGDFGCQLIEPFPLPVIEEEKRQQHGWEEY